MEKSEFELGPTKPKITRKKLSIYEYAGILTQLSEYLSSVKDLNDFVDEPQINNIISPCYLAFQLLKKGVVDVQIDRGYETILFSECEKDENIENEIINYLEQREKDRKEFLVDKTWKRLQ